MNFLELARRLRQECGVSGNGPASVTNQAGEMKRLCDWVAQAYLEIQNKRPDWNWMIDSFSFQTVAGTYEYAATDAGIDATFANWKLDTFRNYITATGYGSEQYMNPMTYQAYRDYYLFSTRRDSRSQPLEFAISPSKKVLVGHNPDDVYTVVGEYYKLPVLLTANTDTPLLPARFHMVIVYRAMMDYGLFEAAPEVIQRGEIRFNEMMRKLEEDQLVDIEMAVPLV